MDIEIDSDEGSSTFTEDEVQEIIDWVESLTIVDLAALKLHWEARNPAEDHLQ